MSSKSNILKFPLHRVRKGSPLGGPRSAILNFLTLVEEKNFAAAGDCLASLFDLKPLVGLEAAVFFSSQKDKSPDQNQRLSRVCDAIEEGALRESILLLGQIFNLNGPVAVVAISHLKKQLENLDSASKIP